MWCCQHKKQEEIWVYEALTNDVQEGAQARVEYEQALTKYEQVTRELLGLTEEYAQALVKLDQAIRPPG